MSVSAKIFKLFSLLVICFMLDACSAIPITKPYQDDLPSVLAQDELLKPYVKLGRIQIVREVYFTDFGINPNLQEWGVKSLQEEAQKLGADALILPEVTSRQLTIVLFPTFPATEYRATGMAIKFK